MFRNHLKIAVRNLLKQKFFAAANIFGLALGIAAAFILLLFVKQEFSYDRGFEDSDRIYRVATDFFDMGGFAKSQQQLLDFLPAATPAVEMATRFDRGFQPTPIRVEDRIFEESNYFEVDSAYFQIFSYDFLEGSPAGIMTAPDEVVLTERIAEKYFGKGPAMGRVLLFGKEQKPFRVTGIVETPKFKTHLAPDLWFSLTLNDEVASVWTNIQYYNYLKLRPGASAEDLEAGLETVLETHAFPASGFEGSLDEWKKTSFAPRFWVQPLTSVHLHSDFQFEVTAGGNLTLVYVLGSIGLFIMLIAGVNYVNLTTAAASSRIKEIGVKQSLGIGRRDLIVQFLSESVVFSLLAMLLAAGLSELLLGVYSSISGATLVDSLFDSYEHLLVLAGFSVTVGLLAGLYPAIYLSGFRPVKLLTNTWAPKENQRVRSSLVIFQFSMAILLLIGSIIVQQQLSFLLSTDKGFEHEGVMVVGNLRELGQQAGSFRDRIEALPQVERTSFARRVPTGSSISAYVYSTPEMEEDLTLQTFRGDENYIPTLGMHLIAGRNFSADLASDTSAAILNEAAVRALGLGDDPLGKEINEDGLYVVGVVSDFNFQSLRDRIEPAVIQYYNVGSILIVKLQGRNVADFIDAVQSIWRDYATEEPLRYSFLDDNFASMVANERILSQAILLFTLMAIFIACLGLFGLTTFAVQRRTKEIGIRKVVGASVVNLVGMLSKDFLKLVVWAFAIGAPLAFLAVSRWLEGFAYHIEPAPLVFLLAGLLAVCTAFLTLSIQTIKAARSNPVEALRYE